MDYRFEGPVAICENFKNRPDYKITINVSRIVKENGNLLIDTSEKDDKISWVTIYVRKKNMNSGEFDIKPIDVKCDSYDQVVTFVADIMNYHESLVKQIRNFQNKPWLKKRVLKAQAEMAHAKPTAA